MSEGPLAYHITFGTYGTRLHGDERGTVDRRVNQPGEPIVGRNEDWQRMAQHRLRFQPIVLSNLQRQAAETLLPELCVRGGWHLHAAAAQADHVHVLLSSAREGKAIRQWLKAWLGQRLSERWPLPVDASWWAKGGSVKWVWDESYFTNVQAYVANQRAT